MSVPVFYLIPLNQTDPGKDVVFPLAVGEYIVGRNGTSDIQLRSDLVSRRQARLVVTPKYVTVVDLKSTNGTWFGAERVTEKRLTAGQEISFGEFGMILSDTPTLKMDSELVTRRKKRNIVPPKNPLTPAQERVFLLAIDPSGLTEKEIGVRLNISVNTVHRHMREIYAAYEVRSRSELILKAFGKS